MIPLNTYGKPQNVVAPLVGKVCLEGDTGLWARRILRAEVWPGAGGWNGFDAVLCEEELSLDQLAATPIPVIHSVNLGAIQEGDVVGLDRRGHVRTHYRRASTHNTLFATDRCNSLCLMCSQPPRQVDDDWRVQEMLEIVGLVDKTTPELGISGGEPTLLKDGFLRVVEACKEQLPETSLHVLSNGRLFRYGAFATRLAQIAHPDLMIGIPVYSDLADVHDHVVQARGAFGETILGLHNLGRMRVPVEIRVVVHRLTYPRLPQLAEFIYRNLTFASHVALMGLEQIGFAIANLDALWVDPHDYAEQLEAATLHLAERGMNVSIYNHQLCTVPQSLWPYCRKAISDWKNEYVDICSGCSVAAECGGFFTSSVQRRMSAWIAPIPAQTTEDHAQL